MIKLIEYRHHNYYMRTSIGGNSDVWLADLKRSPMPIRDSLESLDAVELTEEWLENFSFIRREEKDQSGAPPLIYYELNRFKVFLWSKGEHRNVDFFMPGFAVFAFDHISLTSVHQLQNLYFALTETELTLSE